MSVGNIAILLVAGSIVGFIFGAVVISQVVFRRTVAFMVVVWNIAAAEVEKTEDSILIMDQAKKVLTDPGQLAIAKTIAKAAVAGYDWKQR